MCSLAAPSFRVAFCACTGCAVVALVVSVLGQAPWARRELAFGFPVPTRQLSGAVDLAAHNGRYAVAVLIASLAVACAPTLRVFLDGLLAALLALNAGLIGLALGAYGTRLVLALAVHGALELAAFSLVGGVYLQARRGALRRRHFAAATGIALALLALAGLAETCVAPGATP